MVAELAAAALLAAFVLLHVAAAGLKLYTDYTNSHFQVTLPRDLQPCVGKAAGPVLSDLHLREYGEHNEELIQTVQELDPDLILLGGDLVTFPNPEYENMLRRAAALPMWPRCTGCWATTKAR